MYYFIKISGLVVTALIILNEEMKDIMNIIKAIEDSGLLMKSVCKATENEAKTQET